MQHLYPLPEAIDGRHWVVERGQGSINTAERILKVPLGSSESDRHVRNHELAHAKITPRHPVHALALKYEISIDALQAVEDLRVHRYLRHVGIGRPGVLTQNDMHVLIKRCHHSRREVALLLVASMNTEDHGRALRSLERFASHDFIADVVEKVRLIEKRMDSARLLFRPIGFKQATAPAAQLLDALFPESSGDEETSSQLPGDLIRCGAMQPKSLGRVQWGTLAIQHLGLSMARALPRWSRGRSFREEGAMPLAPYRLPVDGRIFVRKKRIIGGTVLVDGSGSMSLGAEQLEGILAAAPAATIAIYCGRGKKGTLTIVASRGRVISKEGLARARHGSGNVVDGPALRWLAQQSEPRVWVSDGAVTGVNDRPTIDLWAEATLICRNHRITRVEKADAVTRFLKTSRRPR